MVNVITSTRSPARLTMRPQVNVGTFQFHLSLNFTVPGVLSSQFNFCKRSVGNKGFKKRSVMIIRFSTTQSAPAVAGRRRPPLRAAGCTSGACGRARSTLRKQLIGTFDAESDQFRSHFTIFVLFSSRAQSRHTRKYERIRCCLTL